MTRAGPGPADLCMPAQQGAELVATVERYFQYPEYSPPSIVILFAIYRMMGMPRAWQLRGVDDLEQLEVRCKLALREVAKEALSNVQPNEKYVYVWEPQIDIPMEVAATMDLTNEEMVEKMHWPWTMPTAFLERLVRLGESVRPVVEEERG